MDVKNYMERWILRILCIPLLLLLINSCQYDYYSPVPGIIDLRLHSTYIKYDTLFSGNNFTLKFTSIKAIRSDGSLANIYEDVKSIGPTAGGDIYNAFGRDAYDSSLVLGQYYLPPAVYVGLQMDIEPGPAVILDNGDRNIPVGVLPLSSSSVSLNRSFTIGEGKTTVVVLTVDLDATLKALAYSFQYDPHYIISSVTINH